MNTQSLAERLSKVVEGARRHEECATSPREQDFLRPAAVLWQFAFDCLRPDGLTPAAPGEAQRLLARHVVAMDSTRTVWTLRDSTRRRVLDAISPGVARHLRASYQGPVANQQRIVDRWLGGPEELDDYFLEDLAAVTRMMSWYTTPPAWFPTPGELERLRAAARVREPIQARVGSVFSGREREIEKLEDFLSSNDEPFVMSIRGVGGVGKSTVVSKVFLDRLRASTDAIWLYLDFDSPTLDIGNGVTLLVEMTAQAWGQRPQSDALREAHELAIGTLHALAAGGGQVPGRSVAVKASVRELMDAFGSALTTSGVSRTGLALDTFEEMQYANPDHVTYLREFCELLQVFVPTPRVLVVSRAEVALPAEAMMIDAFDTKAALAFLRARGISDPDDASRIIEVAGPHPLNLRLAADLVAKSTGGVKALTGLELRQELIHGRLYRRVLQHIHDEEVQRLAHPGLILRRITPEVIQKVLAPVCKLRDVTPQRARELFEKLQREVALVRPGGAEVLEHRSDVRRDILPLILADEPVRARRLHRAAAEYYRTEPGDVAAAEEVYHRFSLGESSGPWLDRLNPQVASRLRGVLEELPPSVWPTFASYTQSALPQEMWERASRRDQERAEASRLRDLMESDKLEEAAAALHRYADAPPDSPIWRWVGRISARLGRWSQAITALEMAVASGGDAESEEDAQLLEEVKRRVAPLTDSVSLHIKPQAPAFSVSHPLEEESDALELGEAGRVAYRQLVTTAVTVRDRLKLDPVVTQGRPATLAAQVFAHTVHLREQALVDNSDSALRDWEHGVLEAAKPVVSGPKLR